MIGTQQTALQTAVAFLSHALAEGPQPVRAIEERAARAGLTRRTLRRARSQLGVQSRPDGFQGQRVLSLPAPKVPIEAPSPDPEPVSLDRPRVETAAPRVETVARTAAPVPRRVVVRRIG